MKKIKRFLFIITGLIFLLNTNYLLENKFISYCENNIYYNDAITKDNYFHNNNLKKVMPIKDDVEINKVDISKLIIDMDEAYTYTGSNIEPVVTIKNNEYILEINKDYLVEYQNNINAGEGSILIEGINDYTGSIKKTFKINKAQNEILDFKVVDRQPVAEAKFGEVIYKYFSDEALKNPVEAPVEPGIYYVKAYVLETSNYEATESKEALIIDIKDSRIDISNLIIELEDTYTYTGSEIEPVVKIKKNDYALELGKDYITKYENNINAGEATLVVIGINDYFGSVEKTFIIEKAINKFNYRIDKNGNIIISQPLYGGVTIKYYLDEDLKEKATNLIKGNEYYVVIESEKSSNYESMQTEPIKYTYRFDPTTNENNNTTAYIVFSGIILASLIIGGSIIFVVLKKNKIN